MTDFVYDIENDSTLGFKIEGFKMEPSGSGLQASFTCTNIAINIDSSALPGQNTANTQNQENTGTASENTSTNTTNTTTDRRNGTASQTTEQYINSTN